CSAALFKVNFVMR
ncbi:hypothetical protein EC970010_2359B, partial [Escherichia coli 97.0010]